MKNEKNYVTVEEHVMDTIRPEILTRDRTIYAGVGDLNFGLKKLKGKVRTSDKRTEYLYFLTQITKHTSEVGDAISIENYRVKAYESFEYPGKPICGQPEFIRGAILPLTAEIRDILGQIIKQDKKQKEKSRRKNK